MLQPRNFSVDHERFFYEPRAYWTIQVLQSGVVTRLGNNGRVRAPDDHFRNGSKYPVRLTHLLVSPVGYAFRSITATQPYSVGSFDWGADAVSKCRMRVSSPGNAYFEPYDMKFYEFTAVPAMCSPGCATGEPNERQSSLFGITRWDFDVPYFMPKRGTVQFDLSAFPRSGALDPEDPANVYASVLFAERGGRRLSNGRLKPRVLQRAAAANPGQGQASFYPAEALAVPPDAFGVDTYLGANPALWDASGMFLPSLYEKQEGGRGGGGYNELRGFSVLYDQIDYDDELVQEADEPIMMMAANVGVKARTRNCGTGELWWREAAPLALVSPTMTPALVKKLAEPIWLGPGEGLQVELEAPDPIIDSDDTEVRPFYNVGVSFCGYAIVEDNRSKR